MTWLYLIVEILSETGIYIASQHWTLQFAINLIVNLIDLVLKSKNNTPEIRHCTQYATMGKK